MKRWKSLSVALFVAVCILLNLAGKELASRLSLPLWLDSFGTVLCAYAGGPVCGSLVGMTGNLIYGMLNHVSYIYGLTSVALGVIVGVLARRRMLDSLFDLMSVSALAALSSVVISVPLNLMFFNGMTGNLWGDGVISFLKARNWPEIVCVIAGEFYVDFGDKLLTLLALHVLVRLSRLVRRRVGLKRAAAEKSGAALAALIALGLLVPTALPARAEEAEPTDYNNYVQTVYSSNNGLPCGEANDIAQTSDGLLWVGTYAGLYRYNGREFKWMDFSSVRNVNCLYVDEEGRLWIGTNDNGLSIAINERVANVVDESLGLPSNSVRSIIQGADGYYYIGTTGSMQVLTLNSGLKRVGTLREVSHAEVSAADDRGHVAVVTADGRLFLLKAGRVLSALRLVNGAEVFKCCAFDSQGRVVAGTSQDRLYTYDISDGGFHRVGERTCEGLSSINDLNYLPTGELFMSADNGVACLTAQRMYQRINTNDFNNSIDNMLMDYQGNLWFTSSRLGLLRLAPSSFKDVYTAVGMDNRVVNAVTRWKGTFCFGTDKGLDVVNSNCRIQINNSLTKDLNGVRIRCLLTDDRESLWICTYGKGLIEVESDGTRHLYDESHGGFGSRARIAIQLSDGTVVAGGNTGLCYIRDHEIVRLVKEQDGLPNPIILSLTEMPDGQLLVGTDGGGLALLRDGEVTRTFSTVQDGLSSGVILRATRDSKTDGAFLVTSNGLNVLEADGTIRTLKNFPYFNNYCVWMKDEDTMFVMSSAGIYVVSRDDVYNDVEGMSYELLNARRGLNGSLTANAFPFADDHGNLFLCCDRGVFVIDTRHYGSVLNRYRISVSTVRMDGETRHIESGRPIEMGRDVTRIELFPEILNYTIQDPNVGFMLEGFDTEWTILPQSSLSVIVYTNLPSGDYNLRVAVFDNNLTDILAERDFTVAKARAIYDNRWFNAYILIVPMLAVAWLTWFIISASMRRTFELQRRELEVAHQQVQMGNETVIAIAKAVDAKDERTSQHSQRVSEYSVMIAREMGFSDKECENLRRAALLHDIGKIGIPDSILNKPVRLTDEEYAIMKSHVTRGAEILKDFTLIDHVVEGALHHHERYDGRGYPSNMAGENIPIYGRIIGVADAFDAMTANRVYRRQMDFDYVLNEMRKGRGTQFDPHIVDIMLRLIDEGKIDLNVLYPPRPEEETATGGQA